MTDYRPVYSYEKSLGKFWTSMDINTHRPHGYVRKGDKYLPQLVIELWQLLKKNQESFIYDTLCLPEMELAELASVLVEFAEDIHNDIGIWKSLERYNIEYFGTPLPFVETKDDVEDKPINEYRIQHLLWVLYPELNPEIIISPTHRDLKSLSETAAVFLNKRFLKIPRGSSIKLFLSQTTKFGWEVKKKLLWLGTQSYLFRNSYHNYISENGGKYEIPVTDDYICQSTTAWSGLGVIDILSSILTISEKQRMDLRSWYERHQAYYRIIENEGEESKVLNLINNEVYPVINAVKDNPLLEGDTVFGSLIPWDGMWYWSGAQYHLDNLSEEDIQNEKNNFIRDYPHYVYRYSNTAVEEAKEANDRQYQEFLKYYGNGLAVYPDGFAMAADHQKRFRMQWMSRPEEVIKATMDKHKLKEPQPNMPIPRNLLESDNGIGVFYNPDEGMEIMTGFNAIISGLEKKGEDLSEEEEDCIGSLIFSDVISPNFVKRLISEYGSESIMAAFRIPGDHDTYHTDYLLRQYKGAFYRKRYPHISLI